MFFPSIRLITIPMRLFLPSQKVFKATQMHLKHFNAHNNFGSNFGDTENCSLRAKLTLSRLATVSEGFRCRRLKKRFLVAVELRTQVSFDYSRTQLPPSPPNLYRRHDWSGFCIFLLLFSLFLNEKWVWILFSRWILFLELKNFVF